ncbi:hypothetical protein HYPSUDRAFT_193948 [Hypholoma sublateritium FD-334 SS-4]|uniref:Uncharacterized protein n=1 Tax=Hypholoma sublateritium (strain FD-334 SS-4) TaxID=945553 RepID=A0A0D2KMP3_HYPSF|nr:hypothetical protein HYPSUDRAFT_193948 [Hypholoma sublateritium FD-334 SS-4]
MDALFRAISDFFTNKPIVTAAKSLDTNEDSDVVEQPSVAESARCVVCVVNVCTNVNSVTCSAMCRDRLCRVGPANGNMCNYCHRRPKRPGLSQCSAVCEESAKVACLLCKSQPKNRRAYLCGKSCKRVVENWSPYLVLEAPPGHVTFDMVEDKFKEAWKYSGTASRPPVRKVLKVIGTKTFFEPFNEYKKHIGNVVFCYHGTKKSCQLGSADQTQLCFTATCALCSILRTSFRTDLAGSYTAFGSGIYTSTASNKAYNYTGNGTGAIIVSTVALGNVRHVNAFNEVRSCPEGFDSVVFDRGVNGSLNETIVYNDNAIRPVYIILF